MGKKSSATSASTRVSTTSAMATTQNKSSILKSSFAPSAFQLQLFASVVQSFDSQQLRLHDTSSGRLRQQHATAAGTEITSLTWGHHHLSTGRDHPSARKKRKRAQPNAEDAVVAYGTSTSEVCLYSPAEGKIIGKLSGIHERGGIRDFRFRSDDSAEAWSIGGDGKLVQWDMATNTAVRTISLPEPSINILAEPSLRPPQVICGSTKPFSIDLSSDPIQTHTYDAFKTPIQSILRSIPSPKNPTEAFLAVDQDRYLNVFDVEQKKLVRTLVAGSSVHHLDLSSPPSSGDLLQGQLLAAVTKDGVVELFPRPFDQINVINGDIKSKRKHMTRKAHAQVRLVQPNAQGQVPIYTASLRGPHLVLVSVEGGVEPIFQKIRWQDEGTGELLFEGIKEIPTLRTSSALHAAHLNGVKDTSKSHVDESRTVVVNGNGALETTENAIEISSGDDDDETESESEADKEPASDDEATSDGVDNEVGALVQQEDDESASDEEMVDAVAGDEEPSFGDLLASKHPETISIGNSLIQQPNTDQSTAQQLAIPAGMSLGTVLTQALKSNDNNLLESCLHANDNGIIQNTIQRLDSSLAAGLLSKLAERLASRPGRYGHLLSWVQWTCIAHGGAIAGRPDVAAKLQTLYRVLNQRSNSLDQLLLLKGKLDMLEAQLAFRKQLQAQRGSDLRNNDEPGMIYIEGQEDNWSSEDDHDEAAGATKRLGFKTKVPLKKDLSDRLNEETSDDEEDDDDDDEMPTTNGIASDEDEEDEEEDEADSEIDANGHRRQKGVVDIEAEVSGEDDLSDSEEAEGGDDVDDSEEGENGDEEEDDSSMDDFINDGEISMASDDDDDEDEPEVTIRKPALKRSKHR